MGVFRTVLNSVGFNKTFMIRTGVAVLLTQRLVAKATCMWQCPFVKIMLAQHFISGSKGVMAAMYICTAISTGDIHFQPSFSSRFFFLKQKQNWEERRKKKEENRLWLKRNSLWRTWRWSKKALLALAGNWTRASRVAGENSTTEPPMLSWEQFSQNFDHCALIRWFHLFKTPVILLCMWLVAMIQFQPGFWFSLSFWSNGGHSSRGNTKINGQAKTSLPQ